MQDLSDPIHCLRRLALPAEPGQVVSHVFRAQLLEVIDAEGFERVVSHR